MPASAASPDRTGSFRVDILIERTAEAARIVEFLAPPDLHLAVLYGRTNCGKTKLVRNFVIPKLERPVYYGATTPDLPEQVTSTSNTSVPLRDALSRGGIVFLDEFDQLLAAAGQARMEQTGALLAALDRGDYRGTLVLVMQEESLAHLLAFRSDAPSLLENTFEITGLPIEEHIRKLGEFGADLALRYEPQVLEWLSRDLTEFGALGSGDIAEAVDWGFRQYKFGNPDRLITPDDYTRAGGLQGVIRLCLDARMSAAEMRFGKGASEITKAIAEEVVEAARANRQPDFAAIGPRLALPKTLLDGVLNWAHNDGRLLRTDPKEGISLIPRELARLLEAEFEKQWRELAEVRKVLADGLRARKQVDALLPRERFDQINRVRDKLKTNTDETSLVALSALHYPDDHGDASYWISRLADPDCQIDVLIEALFSETQTARLKAATLLAGFEDPEVLNQLYRKALEDPEPAVRSRAVESLAGMDTSELWPRIDREARDKASPYRLSAIEAMRLCHGAPHIATLRGIVQDPTNSDAICAAAINSLATIPSPDAADALVAISLEDPDEHDRTSAATALAGLRSPELVSRALETARSAKLRLDAGGWEIFEDPVNAAWRIVLSVLLAIGNFLVHGSALAVLGDYRRAAVYLAIELAAIPVYYALGFRAAVTIWALNWIFSHFFATRLAMESVGRQVWRYRITRILGSVLFCCCILSFLLLHGSAHALMGRWRRAVTLFVEELAGISLMVLGWYFFADYKHGHHLVERMFYSLYFLYGALGAGLFLHSFWCDFKEIFIERFLMADRGEARLRKQNVVGQMLATATGTQAALQLAEGVDPESARWAQDALLRPPVSLSQSELLQRYEALGDGVPKFLQSSVARNKTDESAAWLAKLWDRASSATFKQRILGALLSHPSQASLREVAPRLRRAGWFTRLRYHVMKNTFGLRLLPQVFVWAAVFALPFLGYAMWEARQTVANPAHSLIHHMRSNFQQPGGAKFGVKSAVFLAENYPLEAAHDIVELYESAANTETRVDLAEALAVLSCAPVPKETFDEVTAALGGPRVVLRTLSLSARRTECASRAHVAAILNEHGSRILDDPGSQPEDVRLAIKALEAAATPESINKLRDFVLRERAATRLRATDKALAEQESRHIVMELKLDAIDSLVRMGSRPAFGALETIARQSLSSELSRQVYQRLRSLPSTDPLGAAHTAYNSADYTAAIEAGKEAKSLPEHQQKVLVPIVAQSYYRRSLEGSADSAARASDEASAIEYFNRALELGRTPEAARALAEIHNRRAERLRAEKEYDLAREEADRAIEADDRFADAYSTKASILQAKGLTDLALETYDKAISLDSKAALPYCMQSDIYLARKQWGMARKLAEQAIAADPTYSLSYHLLSESYKGEGSGASGIERFLELEHSYPNLYWPGRQLATLYHDSSPDPAQGLELSYQKWTSLDRKFRNSLDPATLKNHNANLMESRFTTGRYKEVFEEGRKFAAELKNDPDLLLPVTLLNSAAAVLAGESKAANADLATVEALLAKQQPGYRLTWDFSGTISHLKSVTNRPVSIQPLIPLFEAAQENRQSAKPIPAAVVAAARTSL